VQVPTDLAYAVVLIGEFRVERNTEKVFELSGEANDLYRIDAHFVEGTLDIKSTQFDLKQAGDGFCNRCGYMVNVHISLQTFSYPAQRTDVPGHGLKPLLARVIRSLVLRCDHANRGLAISGPDPRRMGFSSQYSVRSNGSACVATGRQRRHKARRARHPENAKAGLPDLAPVAFIAFFVGKLDLMPDWQVCVF
jgi:hypothetical protein